MRGGFGKGRSKIGQSSKRDCVHLLDQPNPIQRHIRITISPPNYSPAMPEFIPSPPVGGKLCAESPTTMTLLLLYVLATCDFIFHGTQLRKSNGTSQPSAMRMISRHRSGVKVSRACIVGCQSQLRSPCRVWVWRVRTSYWCSSTWFPPRSYAITTPCTAGSMIQYSMAVRSLTTG